MFAILCYWTQIYPTFIDCSTHLGNSIAAIGRAEQSNKTESYMSDNDNSSLQVPAQPGSSYKALNCEDLSNWEAIPQSAI
jgi:hypothetical protein